MHSQNNEEQIILDYFGDYTGVFLDLGANDGITFSNTRALALRGWRGVLVEPAPTVFPKLRDLYSGHKGFYTYPYAIGDHNGKAQFFESHNLVSQTDHGLVSTFHQHEMDRFRKSVVYEQCEVQTYRWKTFANRLKIKEPFDFISIDTEGNDFIIASQIDFSKTRCVCVEWNGNESVKKSFDNLFNQYEYRIIYTSGENLIYAK